jgi:D-alanyl-D-alanine dipeptidase
MILRNRHACWITSLILTALLLLNACSGVPDGDGGLAPDEGTASDSREIRNIADEATPQSAQPEQVPTDPGTDTDADTDSDLASEAAISPVAVAAAYSGGFELPVTGATGFASTDLTIRKDASQNSSKEGTLKAGTAFRILGEDNSWWHIENDEGAGWVPHRFCLINLPDVIPSIIYDNTNAYAAVYRSSGKALPGITGKKLYDAKTYNERLDRDEFLVPVLYAMSKKIYSAQQTALSDGACLKIYEAFRPYDVQMKVGDALDALAASDKKVKAGINTAPWSVGWFIAQSLSNHQRGCAIDVSLSKIAETTEAVSGDYTFTVVREDYEYEMQTPMHELSAASAKFKYPAPKTNWKGVPFADVMTKNAIRLHTICTDAGMSPLSSEWWHFDDLDAKVKAAENASNGRYRIEVNCLSLPAEAED